MVVESIDGDVGFGAGEPLVVDPVPLENFAPGLRPGEGLGVFPPEGLGILEGAVALDGPIFLEDVVGDDGGRGVLLIHGEEVGNVLWLGKGERTHEKPPRATGLRPEDGEDSALIVLSGQ